MKLRWAGDEGDPDVGMDTAGSGTCRCQSGAAESESVETKSVFVFASESIFPTLP